MQKIKYALMPAVAPDVPLRETPAGVMDAPFEHNDDTTMMTVTKNILLAHGRTVQVLRKNCPDAKVGIAPTGDCCLPKDGSPEEVEKAQAKFDFTEMVDKAVAGTTMKVFELN